MAYTISSLFVGRVVGKKDWKGKGKKKSEETTRKEEKGIE